MKSDICSVEDRPLDDADLAARARHGDLDAYEELVVRYQDLAYRAAWLIVGDTAEAQDVAQNAFVKAFHALPRFKEGAPFRPWLLAIVGNEARNQLRFRRHRRSLHLRLSQDRSTGGAVPSPEGAVLAAEQRESLLAAVQALAERDRRVIALRYLLDLNEEEMAAVLHCPRGTVKSRLSRALERLRAEMGP